MIATDSRLVVSVDQKGNRVALSSSAMMSQKASFVSIVYKGLEEIYPTLVKDRNPR